MACYGGLKGILSDLTKSTDHPSRPQKYVKSWPFRLFLVGLGYSLHTFGSR